MSALKEITAYDRNNKKVVKLCNPKIELPPLNQIHEIKIVDKNGQLFVYGLLNKPTEDPDSPNEAVSVENLSINFNDIKNIFAMLTDDQRDIVMHIYHLYKNNKNNQDQSDDVNGINPKIILQGPAGTGKSTVINFLEKLINWAEDKISNEKANVRVLKTAFTGKAAANIEGFTLNHVFSIPIYNTRSLSKTKLKEKQEILKDCIFFICDEISMVGDNTMRAVNARLQQVFENNKIYGDRFVLLVGDLYQIDPVKQKKLYNPETDFWACCKFYELTKIMRQQDEKFITALNNFRNFAMTNDDIVLLRSREVSNFDQVPKSAIHIFYLNDDVDNYNDKIISSSNETEEIVNVIDDWKNWKPANLRLKRGIRYMITRNLDVDDGLANGSTGIVKEFDYDKDGEVEVVWMEFYPEKIGKKARLNYFRKNGNKPGFERWVPIGRSKLMITTKKKPHVNRTVGNMFPLKAAEAMTVHKSQGQTYHEGACIHLTSSSRDKLSKDMSLQYVALTRVTRIEDLYIMGTLEFPDQNSNKLIRTQNEINRLRNERKLELSFETFKDTIGDVVIYLNTGSTFYEHNLFIIHDKWYSNASLLIFTETNTILSDAINIPNFEMAFRSDHYTERCGRGIICYKRPNKSLKIINTIINNDNKAYVTLMIFEMSWYIIAGVTGSLNNDDFMCMVNKLITDHVQGGKCILFVGNFKNETYIDTLDWTEKLSTELTSPEQVQSDRVFSRNWDFRGDQLGSYQYIPTLNKPIYVKMPQFAETNGDSQAQASQDEEMISDDEEGTTSEEEDDDEEMSEVSEIMSNEEDETRFSYEERMFEDEVESDSSEDEGHVFERNEDDSDNEVNTEEAIFNYLMKKLSEDL